MATTEPSKQEPPMPHLKVIGRRDNILRDEKSWVELQDMLPHPGLSAQTDLAIVNAARVSFLGESKGPEQDKKLLFYLLKNRHTTPFEQVEFKFRVRAPVVVWWQWVRHRTWHYNFQSGRYTPFEEDDFYIPTQWRLQSASNKQGSSGDLELSKNREVVDQLQQFTSAGFSLYQQALDLGIAREQARLFLPAWCSYYVAVCKVDAWNLMNFLRLRLASDAQWEIRQFASALYEILRETMPWTAEAFDLYMSPAGNSYGDRP